MPANGRTGRRRGDANTRAKILAAARASFAGSGYDGSTIRGIAAAAGVDPALVHYFFKDKERLFVAAMDVPLDPAVLVSTVLAGDPAGMGERLVRQFLRIWDDPGTGPAMKAILRGATSHEQSANLVREFFGREVFRRIAGRVGLPQSDLRASLAGAQIVGVALLRYLLEVEPLASADPETVVRWVAPSVQRYLTAESPVIDAQQRDERSIGPAATGDTVEAR